MSPLQFLTGIFIGLCLTGVHAQDRTSEAGEAAITDPNAECTPYDSFISSTTLAAFPPIWSPASILPNDAAALALWNSISPSVPTNIQPKGDITGDFSNTTATYPSSDPDCWWTYSTCTTPKAPGLSPDIINVPEPNTLGYGFDDGPNCSHNAFYDYLTEQQQKATMYYIGSNCMNWPYECQRGVTDGHEICVHTWSHHYMTAFSSEDAFAELYYAMQAIKLVTGITPTCWRPPFGDTDDRIRAIAKGLGLRTIIWSYDTFDWEEGSGNVTSATIDANYQTILNNVASGMYNQQGTIVLFHEIDNFTMSEAIKFYPQLKQAFAHIVPVGVAYNITQPYVETNVSQPNFQQYIGGTLTVSANVTSSGTSSGTPTGLQSQSASTTPAKTSAAKHFNIMQDGSVLLAMAVLLSGARALLL